CWNDETIRVQWREPGQAPAIAWGFQPLLRKVGLQPPAPQATPDGAPLVYPPAFTSPTLLAAEAQDAARYWDEPRPANIFVKSAKAGDKQSVTVLIEELGVAWALFCPADALHVRGKGWTAIVSPLPERDPNDGEGLPFAGYVEGTPLKVGEQYDAC